MCFPRSPIYAIISLPSYTSRDATILSLATHGDGVLPTLYLSYISSQIRIVDVAKLVKGVEFVWRVQIIIVGSAKHGDQCIALVTVLTIPRSKLTQ